MTTSAVGLLLSRNLTKNALVRELRSGQIERVRRGAYASLPHDDDEITRALTLARLHIEAVNHQTKQPHWFSHQSAALLHGLPTIMVPRCTHLIQKHRPSGDADPRVRRHQMTLATTDRALLDGLPVTSLERTVLDCSRTGDTTEAVMVLDAYLNRGGTKDVLEARLATMPGHRGVRFAARCLTWADGGAQSPGESRTRVVLLRAGLRPDTQVPVRTRRGRFWVDLGWPKRRVGLEYDGLVKYTRFADGDPADVVFREKLRQDALEEAGWTILRVTARDLRDPGTLLATVRERLHRRPQ